MRMRSKPAHPSSLDFPKILAVLLILFTPACANSPNSLEVPITPEENRKRELLKTEEIIPLMPDGYDKANSYLELAELNEVIGEHVNARRLVRKAGEVLAAIEEENCLQEKTLLLETARLEVIMGAFEEALKLAKQVKSCEGEPEAGERDRILEKISDHFIAEKNFDAALGAAAEIRDEQFKNPLILRVIDGKIDSEEVGEAVELSGSGNSSLKITSMVHLADLLSDIEDAPPSDEMLQQASEVIDGIKDPFQKILKLLLLARAEHQINGPGSGNFSLEKAGLTLRTMEGDSYSEVLLHWGLATTQVRTGDIGGALRTIDSLEFASDQAVGLLMLALENEKSVNSLPGNELMRRALERVEEVGDLFWRAFVYQTAATGMIKKGILEEARANLRHALMLYEKISADEKYDMLKNHVKILKGQVESMLAAGSFVGTLEALKNVEGGKNFLPLDGAYSEAPNAEVFGGMDAVQLFEQEWERVLALSYISRNLTKNGQKVKAYKLARIWDPPHCPVYHPLQHC